jgi:excisionase family DNA binding protein
MTPEQVAAMLRCSVRTLEKWRRDGGGPQFSKVGRRVIYDRGDVKAHIAERKGSSTADFDRYRPGSR